MAGQRRGHHDFAYLRQRDARADAVRRRFTTRAANGIVDGGGSGSGGGTIARTVDVRATTDVTADQLPVCIWPWPPPRGPTTRAPRNERGARAFSWCCLRRDDKYRARNFLFRDDHNIILYAVVVSSQCSAFVTIFYYDNYYYSLLP